LPRPRVRRALLLLSRAASATAGAPPRPRIPATRGGGSARGRGGGRGGSPGRGAGPARRRRRPACGRARWSGPRAGASAGREEGHGEVVICDVGEVVDPDAIAVDALARLHLTARRLGYRLHLLDTGEELRDLLDLMGVADVFARLPLESRGEAEQREQVLGIE